jgi:hypothetical protein
LHRDHFAEAKIAAPADKHSLAEERLGLFTKIRAMAVRATVVLAPLRVRVAHSSLAIELIPITRPVGSLMGEAVMDSRTRRPSRCRRSVS